MDSEGSSRRWNSGRKGYTDAAKGKGKGDRNRASGERFKGKEAKGKAAKGKSKGAENESSLGVRAVPGCGQGVTRESLKRDIWDQVAGKTTVLEFYGDRAKPHGCFSNFFEAPFVFVVPEEFCGCPLSLGERTVDCDFSEKAIMLCKAAAMGDSDSYSRIAASKAAPAAIKRMGRQVTHFDQARWTAIECSVAYHVVHQKFMKVEPARVVLLSTGNCIIAEATSNDANWGTGLDKGDARNQYPSQWCGTNMLGWALMMARDALRASEAADALPEVQAAEACADSSAEAGGPLASSALSDQEKAFLKMAKKARDILKLEEASAAGTALNQMQAKKLEAKRDIFSELLGLAKDLPAESDIPGKNEDVLTAASAFLKSTA
mmetsp:Transcript_118516/g.221428  ORF Transcript_118516/g.221428 Transcript_118516/m.221428 type:complete len:377 (-) Transcript_118516:183-1313(-)